MSKDMVEIRWHGRGGQGAKTACLLLADAAFSSGKYVQGFPEYGPERMGAPITAYNRISDVPCTIHSNIYEPDYVVVVDESLLLSVDVTQGLNPEGAVVINTPKAPEELRPLLNAEVAPYISKLSTRKIHKIINGFGEAAVLAVKAGFDMVQVHGDRMCGSFSSTVFNHRTDEYGGSAENRARFAVEAVKAIRSRLPEIPIDYKLAVRQEDPHYGNAGVVESELGIFVPLLTDAGVTSFHITLANHSSLEDTIPPANHPYFKEQGCFLKFCDEVRRYTDKPITGVGGLNQPDFVEQQLASGRITCAAMSRQLLADPEWPNKVASGQIKEIHRCVRCNKKCLGGLQQHQGTHCIYEKV